MWSIRKKKWCQANEEREECQNRKDKQEEGAQCSLCMQEGGELSQNSLASPILFILWGLILPHAIMTTLARRILEVHFLLCFSL